MKILANAVFGLCNWDLNSVRLFLSFGTLPMLLVTS